MLARSAVKEAPPGIVGPGTRDSGLEEIVTSSPRVSDDEVGEMRD